MATKSETGKLGEDLACRYLISKGYKIIDRNYRKLWGELDVVAKSPDGILVFVEVKTVVSHNVNNMLITPEDQLTSAKARKLRKIASWYAGDNQEIISQERGWRIDLLALTMSQKNCLVKHYENVV